MNETRHDQGASSDTHALLDRLYTGTATDDDETEAIRRGRTLLDGMGKNERLAYKAYGAVDVLASKTGYCRLRVPHRRGDGCRTCAEVQ